MVVDFLSDFRVLYLLPLLITIFFLRGLLK